MDYEFVRLAKETVMSQRRFLNTCKIRNDTETIKLIIKCQLGLFIFITVH